MRSCAGRGLRRLAAIIYRLAYRVEGRDRREWNGRVMVIPVRMRSGDQ